MKQPISVVQFYIYPLIVDKYSTALFLLSTNLHPFSTQSTDVEETAIKILTKSTMLRTQIFSHVRNELNSVNNTNPGERKELAKLIVPNALKVYPHHKGRASHIIHIKQTINHLRQCTSEAEKKK